MKNEKKLKLNLGCEDKIMKDFINVDITPRKGVFVHDLNKYPLPFKNNSAGYVLASHVLEHLDDPTKFMLELYRICDDRAIVEIFVPHFSVFTTYSDLTHKRGLSYFTFGEKWTNKILYNKFKVVERKLNFTRINHSWLNYIFNPLINLSPVLYERFFCYLLPCSEIYFKLKVTKNSLS